MHISSTAAAAVVVLGSFASAAVIPSFPAITWPQASTPKITACPAIEFITARGTTEPQNGSFTLNPIVKKITQAVPSTAVYDVVYPANTDFTMGPIIGAKDLLNHFNSRATACPATHFVLAGYSQGAMIVQRALPSIPAAAADKIKAVIMFGNPAFDAAGPSAGGTAKGKGHIGTAITKEWQPKLRDFCNFNDPICAYGSDISVHLGYPRSDAAKEAVSFVTGLVRKK
ncbi:hypothetical protein HDU88_001763 [Geranomyces variabilis]|nr:hypothetical protein HDU88_001763 [Geranomyces variabilis]